MLWGATKRFFEFSKTIPGVSLVGALWCDTPEIELFNSLSFGIKDGGGEQCDGGWEFAVTLVGSGLHIVARVIVVEKEAGGDYLAVFWDGISGLFFWVCWVGVWVMIFNEIESGKRLG